MKNFLIFSIIFAGFACTKATQKQAKDLENQRQAISYEGIADRSFSELFTEIKPKELVESPITLASRNNIVITAGNVTDYNSMVAGDGGVGVLMGKAVTFCGLRGNRYTLEVLLKDSIYTFSVFDERFRADFMKFGEKSGRDSQKMKETALTAVSTPSGLMTFKEARLVIECQLAQTHTINPNELYATKNKQFFVDAQKEVGSWHKIVFGDITHVWVRK
ncbi:MAG: flavin reductase family protein [Prevotellaceae bacterium]|jgi:flavin reductase (DIM6/NTAB) family NADH-FMN oxidoreductase RutF|nr:flavin reductase family protein [Prevotellaceae bacterium]